MKVLLLLVSCLIINSALGWYSTGHMTTATVAYNDLLQNNPKILDKANAILQPLSEFFLEPLYPFIAAAEWPDDIKGQKWTSFNLLHFLNFPIVDPDFHGDIKTAVDNATFALNQCKNVLMNSKSDFSIIGRSMCLRLIIHIIGKLSLLVLSKTGKTIGDIHQPLHTANLFSEQFPTGDMGGNLFMINYGPKKYGNLHAYWDDTAHSYGEIQAPLAQKDFDKLNTIAVGVTTKYPRSALQQELSLKSFEEWVDESGKHAFEAAYDSLNLHSGDTISDAYDARAKELVDHQLALGGYRLADALTIMLGGNSESVVEQMLKM